MNVIPQKEKEDYIKENHLQYSYLPVNILYQCKGTIPEKINIGKIEDYKIFFEEGISSFKRRHYKLQKDVTSWNLVVSNGKITSLLSVANIDWLQEQKIEMTGEYTVDFLINFLKTKNKKVNPLKPPIPEEEKKTVRYQKLLTKEEVPIVNEFIRRMRQYNKLTKEQQTNKIKKGD